MEQPSGCENGRKGEKVCLLGKALYSLNQASRQWNERFVNFLVQWGFVQSKADPCVFIEMGKSLYLAIYVDDGLLCAENETEMNVLLNELNENFYDTGAVGDCI